jgi:uncharacterized membrane protein YhaH (DUF805 family)
VDADDELLSVSYVEVSMDQTRLYGATPAVQFGKKASSNPTGMTTRSVASVPYHVAKDDSARDIGNTYRNDPNMLQYFLQALSSKYFAFQGRASRKEFWSFFLFYIVTFIVTIIVGYTIDISMNAPKPTTTLTLFWLLYVYFLIPGIAIAVRRLHDAGYTGWVYLVNLIPTVGAGVLLGLCTIRSSEGANKYGPSPKDTSHGNIANEFG